MCVCVQLSEARRRAEEESQEARDMLVQARYVTLRYVITSRYIALHCVVLVCEEESQEARGMSDVTLHYVTLRDIAFCCDLLGSMSVL